MGKEFKTRSGIPVKNVYTAKDLPSGFDPGMPGVPPYLRGIRDDLYRGRHWTMRQYAGFGSAEESNKRYHYLLSQGVMGLSVAFDLPTQLGLDPDNARSKGEVGKVGVSIASIDDMKLLFKGIDLSQVSTSMTINATAPILLALYVAVAEENKVSSTDLRGTVQNDVLKEYLARGNYIYPALPSLRLATDLFSWCVKHAPKWNPISISGYHIREAGSSAVQELAFTFGNAIEYVAAAVKQGLPIDEFAGQLSFFFNVHSDFFEEIAKFRAARKLWSWILSERFHAKDPRSLMLRFHSQTAGSTLTAQQPENNIVRVAYQAMAAALGGTQSLHTNAMDEALALPTEQSARLALRTQQVLANETGIVNTVDPLGGSYFIEALTLKLEEEARALLGEIDKRGGMVKCIENGWAQGEVLRSAYEDQKKIDAGETKVVGVNAFQEDGASSAKIPTMKIAPELEQRGVERVRAFRASRAQGRTDDSLRALKAGAMGNEANLQERILDCVRARATLGEISTTLKEVFGEFQGVSGI